MRDRIVELRRVAAGELRPAPKNWRTHPQVQREALTAVLEQIGIVDAVIARETDDGLELVVDLDEAEAELALATIDPLAAMAETNAEVMRSLIDGLETQPEINYGHLYQELDVDLVHTKSRMAGVGAVGNTLKADPNDEAYTPAELVEVARAMMGGIDLDPASCEQAQATVQAERYFTTADDGLSQLWSGRVWLNPPWSQKGAWVDKLIDEKPDVWTACMTIDLTNTAVRRLARAAAHIWCPDRAPAFRAPDGTKLGAWFATALFFGGSTLAWDSGLLGDGLVLAPS